MRARAAAGRPAPLAKPAKRRQPPLRLRRSDLPLGTPQPWAVDLAPARLVDVALPSPLARLADEEGGGGSAPPSYVSLCLSVDAADGGMYVRGDAVVAPDVFCGCDACGAPVGVALSARITLWLDSSPAAASGARGCTASSGSADELAWRPSAASVDLTPTVAAALSAALPARVSCGAPACEAAAARGWGAGAAPAAGLGGAGAGLEALRARFSGGGRKAA